VADRDDRTHEALTRLAGADPTEDEDLHARIQPCFLPQKLLVFVAIPVGRHRQSVDTNVLQHIRRMQPGTVFTPKDLAELGSREAVASALSRHVKARAIERPAHGLYMVPKVDPEFGLIPPSPEAIARALGDRDGLALQPAGAYAANRLGLTEQVPLKIVYLTNGTSRRIRIGRQQIVFRRTTPRNMATAGRISGLVIQALRHFGRAQVDATILTKLRRRLTVRDRNQLARDAHLAPAWIGRILRDLAVGA
jgi:hypothetical protein